jgi:hypothetical protein
MKIIALAFLLCVSSYASLPSTGVIANPVLNEDMKPPRVEKCMSALLAPIVEPAFFSGPRASKDRMVADYLVVGADGTDYHWYFRSTDDQRWRYFQYHTGIGGTAIGMWARGLETMTKLETADGQHTWAIDISQCARFLHR